MTLLCPVRGCRRPLARGEGWLECPAHHRFDLARSGYCNLLQPQDRRSPHPGDSPAAVAARRRLFDAGHGDWLVPHLQGAVAVMEGLGLPRHRRAILDVGCGEGFYLAALAGLARRDTQPAGPPSWPGFESGPESGPAPGRAPGTAPGPGPGPGSRKPLEAHGLDLAAGAVDLAARRYPAATWVVANADRFLPYEDGAFDLATVLTARLNPGELKRVLTPRDPPPAAPPATDPRPGGWLLVAVPGADDLIELRQAVLGEGQLRQRLPPTVAALAPHFELLHQATATARLHLSPDHLHDLLAATYRAGRDSERRRAAALHATEITVSRELACFRPRTSQAQM